MTVNDIGKEVGLHPERPGEHAKEKYLPGRKSVLMGMLTSGFVIANAAHPSSASAGSIKPIAATQPPYAPKWMPSTAYPAGQQVVSPNNDVVSAIVAHTSSAAYSTDVARWRLSNTFAGKMCAADLTFIVSPRGSDANDGLSCPTAKATIAGAMSAAGGAACVIQLLAGSYTMPAAVALKSGSEIRGAGTYLTFINYTGSGAAFTSAQPGVRTYSWRMSDFTLSGPGRSSAAVGIDLDSVSCAHLHDVVVSGFGKGIRVRSVIDGGAVYDRLTNTTVIDCATGLSVEPSSSNATTLDRCRACACDVGVKILDSNDTVMHACQIESNTVGVHIEASSTALADDNAMDHCRFEANTTAWRTTAYVRETLVTFPHIFGAYTVSDLGSRTHQWGGETGWKTTSVEQSSAGSWRFERLLDGGAELPAMVIRDAASGAGTPVTCQIETERSTGYFLRGKSGGVSFFDVSAADGSIRLPKGGNVELSARTTDAAAPTAAGVRLYAKTVGAKTALFARFPTGAVVQLAIQP
jgi:hypothetical protein